MSIKRRLLAFAAGVGLALAGAPWGAGAAENPAQIAPHQVIRLPHQRGQDNAPVVTSVVLSPRGDLVATAGDDHLVWIWQVSDGTMVRKLRGHDDWVRSLAFHPSGDYLASAGDDGRIIVWNVATGAMVHRIGGRPSPTARTATNAVTPRDADCIYRVLYSPDGDQLAAAGFQDSISLYDSANGQLQRQLACPTGMRALRFSPDGELLAAGGRNGLIRVWNAADGHLVRDLEAGPQRIRTIAFSGEGEQIAAAGDGPFLHVWQVADGAEVKAFVVRPGRVLAIVFCGQDQIATGASDNSIRIWSIDREQELFRLAGHEGSVSAVEFSAAENMLISGSFDTTVRFWRLPSQSSAATARAPVGPARKK